MEYGGTVIEEENSFTEFDEGDICLFEDEDIISSLVVEYGDVVIVIWEDSTADETVEDLLFLNDESVGVTVKEVVPLDDKEIDEGMEATV